MIELIKFIVYLLNKPVNEVFCPVPKDRKDENN